MKHIVNPFATRIFKRLTPCALLLLAACASTRHTPEGSWSSRFDCIIVVTAPDDIKINRFVRRSGPGSNEAHLREDARRRLQAQRTSAPPNAVTFIVENDGSLADLDEDVKALWAQLVAMERAT